MRRRIWRERPARAMLFGGERGAAMWRLAPSVALLPRWWRVAVWWRWRWREGGGGGAGESVLERVIERKGSGGKGIGGRSGATVLGNQERRLGFLLGWASSPLLCDCAANTQRPTAHMFSLVSSSRASSISNELTC